MKKTTILLLTFFTIINTGYAQSLLQKGSDIDAEAEYDGAGCAVSMPDNHTLAVGASANGRAYQGHVRIYRWNGSAWIQKGADIDGEAVFDGSGFSLSMPDSNTIAIGAQDNDGNGSNAGHVRIYRWNGSTWRQRGADIDGEAAGDYSGFSVSMPDSNTVAIGATYNDDERYGAGHVRIYRWNGSAWVQKGSDIDREATGDLSGWSVSMPDSNTVAIGAPFNDGNGTDAGHVRIYQWDGSAWLQKGTDIDGEAAYDGSGWSVSMPDNNTVAIGALYNDGNGTDAGHVRIYRWNGSAWVQKGIDIDGEAPVDFSGYSVSMPDSNTVAIGAPFSDGNGRAGRVRIYQWSESAWMQKGIDIDGEAANDFSGLSVSMPDSSTVAIGAPDNKGKGTDAGHARVYSFESVTNIGQLENDFGNAIKIYPNPTKAELSIDLGVNYNDVNVIIRNPLGQDILKKKYSSSSLVHINIPGEAGPYFIEVKSGHKKAILKVMKE